MSGGVTRDQIASAKEINIENYILSREPNNVKRVGSAYYLKDHDSLRISNGLWKWESQGIGGKNVVDYLIKVRGYSFVDAVRHLAGEDYYVTAAHNENLAHTPPKAKSPPRMQGRAEREASDQPEREPLKLPPRNTDNSRVITYLQSRGISKPFIDECIEQRILYESGDGWHNCCFIGRDVHGKAKFAALRGTHGDFKRDADGSDKRFGFALPPNFVKKNISMNSSRLAVFESPIDALSHLEICRNDRLLHFNGWRLALGGTSLAALTHFLENHPEIRHCFVCTDNDEAGNRCAAEIADKLQIEVVRVLPPDGEKDWNAALQKIRNEVKSLEDVRKDIRFIDSDYNELFRIKDGDSIKITRYDGEEFIKPCRFIDECHTRVGNDDYHICEFAERMEKNGNRYRVALGGEPILHIIAAKYGEKLQDWGIAMTDEAIRQRVGGDYTVEPLYGASKSIVFGALVRGKDGIAVCGVGGKDNTVLTSLHPYWVQKFKRELSPAQRAELKAETLHGEVAEAKALTGRRDSADRTVPNKATEAR